MRPALLLVAALSAACTSASGAPEPEVTRTPAPPSVGTPAPSPSLEAPSQPVPGAPPQPRASPVPAAPPATQPDASADARRVLDFEDVFPNGMPEPAWGKPLPPPPTAYEPEAEARVAPYQACTRDRDCAVAVEGCCDERGYARGIGVARKQLEAYRSLFSCPSAKCVTRAGDMLCGDGPTPRCETVRAPKARCVEGRCTFHGHY